MDARSIVIDIMKSKGITQAMLAKMIGVRNQSNVSESLKREIKVSLFIKMIDALGYEVVVRRKNTGRKGDGVYVLEADQK